jgi:hypothetical protein
MRLDEAIDPVPRRRVTYWCENGHCVEPFFAADVTAPETWECPHCGLLSGRDRMAPPTRAQTAPFKTHLAYVKERRTEAEGAALLEEALAALRQRRGRTG